MISELHFWHLRGRSEDILPFKTWRTWSHHLWRGVTPNIILFMFADSPKRCRSASASACTRAGHSATEARRVPLHLCMWSQSVRRRGHGGRAACQAGSGCTDPPRVCRRRTKFSSEVTSSPPVPPASISRTLVCHSWTSTDSRCLNTPNLSRQATAGSGDEKV